MVLVGMELYRTQMKPECLMRSCINLQEAKTFCKSITERNYFELHGYTDYHIEFHDTETKRTWTVYGIGLSKRDYRDERTEVFKKRYLCI